MATIRATFKLTDEASPALAKIAAEAELLDKRLESIDRKFGTLDRTQTQTNRSWGQKAQRMERDVTKSYEKVENSVTKTEKQLGKLTSRPHTIRVRSDVSHARHGFSMLRKDMNEVMKAGSAIERVISGGGQSRRGRVRGGIGAMFGFLEGGANSLNNKLRGVGVNLGPFSAKLSTVLSLVIALGPVVLGTLATGLGVVAAGMAAIGVAAGAAAVSVAAFTTGILAIAAPIAIATKHLMAHRKALYDAEHRLDKLRAGTKAYKKALREVEQAKGAMSKPERIVNADIDEFVGAWNRFIMNGPAGQQAFRIMHSGMQMVTGMLPFAAKQMTRFTNVTGDLFDMAQRRMPQFEHALARMMHPWAGMYRTLGQAGGNFGMGIINVMTAMNPLAMRMSTSLLAISRAFAAWTGSTKGQHSMRKFFLDMWPIIKRMSKVIFDLGEAWVKIAGDPAVRKETMQFLGWLDDIIKNLPGFVHKMTVDFDKVWPVIDKVFKFIVGYFGFLAPKIGWLIGGVDTLGGKFHGLMEKLFGVQGASDSLYWTLTGLLTLKVVGKPLFKGMARMAGMIAKMSRDSRGVGKALDSKSVRRLLGNDAAKGAGALGEDIEAGMRGDLGKFGAKGVAKRALGRASSIVNFAQDAIAPNVHVTNTMDDPVPVIIVGDLSGGGRLPKLPKGGPGGGRVPAWAKALGLAGAAAVGAGVIHHSRLKDHVETFPAHPNGATVMAHGGMPSPAAAAQMGLQSGTLSAAQVAKYPRSAIIAALQANPGNPTLIEGLRLVNNKHNPPGHVSGKQAAVGVGVTALGIAGLFGPDEVLGGGAAIGWGGRALAGALGIGGAAAAPAAAMADTSKAANKAKRDVRSVGAVAHATSQRVSAQTQAQAMASIRAMVASATSGAQNLMGVFGNAVGSVWNSVKSMAGNVGNAIAGAVSGGGSGGGGGGGGGTTMGPPAPMGGSSGGGGFGNMGKVNELAKNYQPYARALLGNLPGGGTITAAVAGHKKYTASGNISQHWLGQALDIGYGSAAMDAKVGAWIRQNAGAFGVRSDQVFYPGNDPTGEHSGANHHVHVGFKATGGPGGSVQHKGDGHGIKSHVRNSRKGGGGAGVHVSFDGAQFHIHGEDDYEAVAEKLVSKLESAMGSMTTVDTSEMTGA